jgi:hypothetical protein
MFLIHVFGAMGAGDVKLFGAVGSVIGVSMVPMTFVVVVMLGAVLAIYTMLRSGTMFSTLHGVLRIFVGIMPGWEMPRFAIPPDRKHTIPLRRRHHAGQPDRRGRVSALISVNKGRSF